MLPLAMNLALIFKNRLYYTTWEIQKRIQFACKIMSFTSNYFDFKEASGYRMLKPKANYTVKYHLNL